MVWKRIGTIALMLTLGWLCLSSCGKTPTPPTTDGFQCTVSLDYGGAVYTGTLDRLDPSCASLTVTEPETLDGLSMTWDGQTVAVTYAGMSMSFDGDALPVGAAVKGLCRALDACRDRDTFNTVYDGAMDGVPFTVTFDDVSGMPLTMDVPSIPLRAVFSGWTVPDTL